MIGIATKLYLEKEKNLATKKPEWPLLEELFAQGYFSYVDLALAEKYTDSEEIASLFCFLSLAKRAGHLCVKIEEEKILPNPIDLHIEQPEQDPLRLRELIQQLEFSLAQGALSIPRALATPVSYQEIGTPFTPLCIARSHYYYFQSFWLYETHFLHCLDRLKKNTPHIHFEFLHQKVATLEQQKQLLPEQACAILKASDQTLTIISGGPGTGKTYTAGILIKMMWQSLPEEERASYQIALAAPTGKAAANLQGSLLRAIGDLPQFKSIAAKTLHALLGIKGDGSKRDNALEVLPYDLIIVDESSMIDVRMMVHLLSAIKSGSRLILLGDRHQLPPVEAGSLFADMMTVCADTAVELVTCMRAESKGIIDLASAINKGSIKEVSDLLNRGEGLSWKELSANEVHWEMTLMEEVIQRFSSLKLEIDKPEQLLQLFNSFRMLSPLRVGPFGVEELNRHILHHLMRSAKRESFFVAPIMIMSNDPQMELFNGESGILIRKSGWEDNESFCSEGDIALFRNKSEEGHSIRSIPALLLPKFEYAYCLSVHKSQGSEYDHVLFVMPLGTEHFGREVFYTAATRAKKSLELWATKEIMDKTLQRQTFRLSGIKT